MSDLKQARECILGKVDLDALLDYFDPEWKKHFGRVEDGQIYYASEVAFAFYTEDMPLTKLREAIQESGAGEQQ